MTDKVPIICVMSLALCIVIGCSSSNHSPSSHVEAELKDETPEICSGPDNPYFEGTGHYAGFEWAEQNQPASCDGNPISFTEGCEKYLEQSNYYEECAEN